MNFTKRTLHHLLRHVNNSHEKAKEHRKKIEMNGVLDELESFTMEIKVFPIYYMDAHGAWFVPTGTKDRPAGISNSLYKDAYVIFAMKEAPIEEGDLHLAMVSDIKEYIKQNIKALPKTVVNNELGFLFDRGDVGMTTEDIEA